MDIDTFKDQFEPRVSAAMTKNNVPGMAIAIVHDDRIVYSRGFGSRNLKKFLPYTPDTLNGFGSCTKSFTCLAIMQLYEQGKLDLQEPVSKYIPFKIGLKDHPITIHHLMTHTSGIPNLGSAELVIGQNYPIDLGFPPIPFSSWEDFYTHLNQAQEEILIKPTEHFFYFNGGYTILGQIINKVSGMRYEEYVRTNILDPLSMNRSGFLESHITQDDNISIPYEMLPDRNGKPKPTPAEFPYNQFIFAPGGLISSVNEMANYIIMMMNEGKFGEKQLLDAEKINKMHKMHHIGQVHSVLSAFGEKCGYGYGWSLSNNFLGKTLIQHGGGITGGISLIGFIKELKIGFAAIGNAAGFPVHEVYAALTLLQGKDPDKDIPFFIRDTHYNKLCGEYMGYKGIVKGKIVNKLGVLHLETQFPPTSYPLFPSSDDHETLEYYVLTPTGVKMPVIFSLDKDKKAHFTFERGSYHKVREL
ncbi:MAG: serine hydrolase [Candidatus Hodarchaeota archaeon]